jgi:predicted nucleotidyltransferase
MILHNVLEHIFKNQSNLKVLRVLNSLKVGVSGRETSRLANISLRSVQKSLEELEKLNLVRKQIGGRENLYNLNRENNIVKNIIEMIFKEENKFRESLFLKIKTKIGKLADSIILFGSVALKKETVNSDLDICIVYSKNRRAIENRMNKLRDVLAKEYGVKVAPFYIKKSDFRTKAAKSENPINNIVKEGKVISGTKINQLVNG